MRRQALRPLVNDSIRPVEGWTLEDIEALMSDSPQPTIDDRRWNLEEIEAILSDSPLPMAEMADVLLPEIEALFPTPPAQDSIGSTRNTLKNKPKKKKKVKQKSTTRRHDHILRTMR